MIYEHEDKPDKRYDGVARPLMPVKTDYLVVKMNKYLTQRQLSYPLAFSNGWYPTREIDGYDRIVIPCINSLGIPYYQARAMDENITALRYYSPRATREDSIVLLWPFGPVKGVVICEGPTDALAACGEGYIGIGLMGNVPPLEVLQYIASRVKPFEVIVVPDLDTPKMSATVVAYLAGEGIHAVVKIPTQKDLAKMTVAERGLLLHG